MQSIDQSQMKQDIERFKENAEKNVDMMRDHVLGEEGVDYIQGLGDMSDPNLPNAKLLERQIRREINQLKMVDAERAKEYEDYMFKRNELDEVFATQYDMSEVKFYPGSAKGPNPEDDIETYSRWFVENQPKSIYQG